MKRGRAANPNGMTPEDFEDSGPVSATRLTNILSRFWELDVIPPD